MFAISFQVEFSRCWIVDTVRIFTRRVSLRRSADKRCLFNHRLASTHFTLVFVLYVTIRTTLSPAICLRIVSRFLFLFFFYSRWIPMDADGCYRRAVASLLGLLISTLDIKRGVRLYVDKRRECKFHFLGKLRCPPKESYSLFFVYCRTPGIVVRFLPLRVRKY